MKTRICWILIASLFLTACASSSSRWLGRTDTELIAAKGAPSRTTDDGAGGRILVYDAAPIALHDRSPDIPIGGGHYLPGDTTSTVIRNSFHYFVDANGTIYRAIKR